MTLGTLRRNDNSSWGRKDRKHKSSTDAWFQTVLKWSDKKKKSLGGPLKCLWVRENAEHVFSEPITNHISNFSGAAHCSMCMWVLTQEKTTWMPQEVNKNDLTLQRLLCGKHKSRSRQKQLPFMTSFEQRKGQYARFETAKNLTAASCKRGSSSQQWRSFWCHERDIFQKLSSVM